MIELPPSKSIGARYMVITYFAGTLPGDPLFQDNDDLIFLQEALLEVYSDEEPIDFGDSPIDVGASGTALRFVTAVCASSPGADYIVTGSPRLMQRPMLPLIQLLREAGATIDTLGENSTGPYRVTGNKLQGGNFSIRGDISSQFISALMLVAPSWEKGIKLNFTTPLVSKPYIEMTSRLMSKFGIKPLLSDESVEIPHGDYVEPEGFQVEADWSSASFFYEACSLGADNLKIANLIAPALSLQGDSATDGLFAKLGVKSTFHDDYALVTSDGELPEKIETDFKDCPDLMLPFGVACICLDIPFRFTNVAHLRLKESDRLDSFAQESRKLGYILSIEENAIEWKGEKCQPEEDPVISTHDDHRVAMSFAMTALKLGEIRIENPRVVEKSFINFWQQIPKLGLRCEQRGEIMTVYKYKAL